MILQLFALLLYCLLFSEGIHRPFGNSDVLPQIQRTTMEQAEQELHQIIDGFDPWRPQYSSYYADPHMYRRNSFDPYRPFPYTSSKKNIPEDFHESKNHFTYGRRVDGGQIDHNYVISLSEKQTADEIDNEKSTKSRNYSYSSKTGRKQPKASESHDTEPKEENEKIQQEKVVKIPFRHFDPRYRKPAYLPAIPRHREDVDFAEQETGIHMELVPVEPNEPVPVEPNEPVPVQPNEPVPVELQKEDDLWQKADTKNSLNNTLPSYPIKTGKTMLSYLDARNRKKEPKRLRREQVFLRKLYDKLFLGSQTIGHNHRKHKHGKRENNPADIPTDSPFQAFDKTTETTHAETENSLVLSPESELMSGSDESDQPKKRPVNNAEPESDYRSDGKSLEKPEENSKPFGKSQETDKANENGKSVENPQNKEFSDNFEELPKVVKETETMQAEHESIEKSEIQNGKTSNNDLLSSSKSTQTGKDAIEFERKAQKKTELEIKKQERNQKKDKFKKTERSDFPYRENQPPISPDYQNYLQRDPYRNPRSDYIPRFSRNYNYQPDYGSYFQYPFGSNSYDYTSNPYINQYGSFMNQYPNYQRPSNYGSQFRPMQNNFPNQYDRPDPDEELLQNPNWFPTMNSFQQREDFQTPNAFQGRRHRILFHNGKLSIIADGGDYAKG